MIPAPAPRTASGANAPSIMERNAAGRAVMFMQIRIRLPTISGPLQLNEEVGEEDVPGPLDHEHQAAGLLDLHGDT